MSRERLLKRITGGNNGGIIASEYKIEEGNTQDGDDGKTAARQMMMEY
jgi:hypothetical protein